jgi:hypothetical protein
VIVCFANPLNPHNVGPVGNRKWARRFQIAQKTSGNCQTCIDSGKLPSDLLENLKAGAFLQDFIGLWMLGLEMSSNLTPENHGNISIFTKLGADTLSFHTNPYFLACKSEPGQRRLVTNGKIERCEVINADGKPSCYK